MGYFKSLSARKRVVLILVGIIVLVLTIIKQFIVPRVDIFSNEYIREIPYRAYALNWGVSELLIAFMCVLLGVISIFSGVAKSLSNMTDIKLYLIGFFSIFFGLNTWFLTEYSHEIFSPAFIYYAYWFTYFTYSLPLFYYLFQFLKNKIKTITFFLLYITTLYSVFSLIMLPLPFVSMEISANWYTFLMALSFNIILLVVMFKVKQKRALYAIRIYGGLFFTTEFVLLFQAMSNPHFYIHDGYKNAVAFTAFYFLGFMLYDNAKEFWEIKTHIQLLELRNQHILENYKATEAHREEVAKLEHEMRHNLFALELLCREGKYEELLKNLQEQQNNYEYIPKTTYSGNQIIDAVISRGLLRAKEMGFTPEIEIPILPQLTITDTHLVSVFSNMMNNALESLEKMPYPQTRYLKIKIKNKPPYIYISVKNTFLQPPKVENGYFLSSKNEKDSWKHGHGIKIIKSIASQYGGLTRFREEAGVFEAEVALNCVVKK